jgi:hypothetical protein
MCLLQVGLCCRNPTLAKCGGEAQHLEKLEVRSLSGLPNVQSSTAREKTTCIGVFLVSLERSSNVDIENALALAIRTFAAQVMGKRRAGSQTGSLDSRPLKVGNRPLPDVRFQRATCHWKDLDERYNFAQDVVSIGGQGEKI